VVDSHNVATIAVSLLMLRQSCGRRFGELDYYEASHERSLPAERLILLAIALESLFLRSIRRIYVSYFS